MPTYQRSQKSAGSARFIFTAPVSAFPVSLSIASFRSALALAAGWGNVGPMTKPVVGVIGNAQVVNDRHNVQLVGQRNMRAIAEVAGALPLMFAGTPDITDVD